MSCYRPVEIRATQSDTATMTTCRSPKGSLISLCLLWAFFSVALGLSGQASGAEPSALRSVSEAMSARDLLRQADIYGERTLLTTLAKDRSEWRHLIGEVSWGRPGWTDLALRLVVVAQGKQAADLRIALEDALIVSPRTVLVTMTGNPILLSVVCGPSAQPSYDLATNSVSERLSAVLTLRLEEDKGTRTPLLNAIDQCADALEGVQG
jgi:hypothetical protein